MLTPEQQARQTIDALLGQAGWVVQGHKSIDLSAGRGIAVREFPTATGPVDYMLYVDRKVLGSVEAKREGITLSGVEAQGNRYAEGFAQTVQKKGTPHWQLPLPFHYLSTGKQTLFASRVDPVVKPRQVFAFHRPEHLLDELRKGSLRKALKTMPRLDPVPAQGMALRAAQVEAVENLELSLVADRPRALIEMTMGAGKTIAAVACAYRLITHCNARVLFVVDRVNLGIQARVEFENWCTPDDGRLFKELYNVQMLRSNEIDPAARVVITTIQRLYSILRGDEDFNSELEERSSFDVGQIAVASVMPVVYNPAVPIERFSKVFVDECHRSIYGCWGQVLDYFDAFLTGLTATADKHTYGFFQGNVVTQYTHEQSVIDGVNVDFDVYRIKTEITAQGASLDAGDWVRLRDKDTLVESSHELDDVLTYDENKIDRAVVAEDQIRTVIRTFKERLFSDIFPGRTVVPKTIVFCKNDQHAEDVLKVIRNEFGEGSDFAKKITYRTEGSTQQHIRDFRNDPRFRIAVSVDQIATGTDIKPVECLLFMRMVGSRLLFEQMKGRGVRTIDADTLQSVTPDARIKDRFVIVDAVGITDDGRAWAASKPLDREPSVPIRNLLQAIGEGVSTDELLSTIASRLARLAKRVDAAQAEKLTEQLNGLTLNELAGDLLTASDPDVQERAARRLAERDEHPADEPLTDAQLAAGRDQLVSAALAPLLNPAAREAIATVQAQTEQVIDFASRDVLLFAGPVSGDRARKTVEMFEQFIAEHRDVFVALAAHYAQPAQQRLTFRDVKALSEAIKQPPYNLTEQNLWEAYKTLESSKVRGAASQRILTDIVQLVRFALQRDDELVPHEEVVRFRFDQWLEDQRRLGREFTADQMRWLALVREHIVASMTIEIDDFDEVPFNQHGGRMTAHQLFGDDLPGLLDDLNKKLAAL
ncbi:MAG: type I restriction-modification enzyme R subunit C-terminal domain-containing protein [Solirubrobacteraceae bacterium]